MGLLLPQVSKLLTLIGQDAVGSRFFDAIKIELSRDGSYNVGVHKERNRCGKETYHIVCVS
jgi:hypothetical protein